MKTIAQKLNVSPETYNWMIFNTYFMWCARHASSSVELQKLTSSQSLFNWFQKEYKKQEEEFLFLTSRFTNLATQSYVTCYNRCIEKVFDVYPKLLLEKMKTHRIEPIFIHLEATKIKLNHTSN